jgi:DNA-binding response OmpR family regulator
MTVVVLISDREPATALPGLLEARRDVKHEPLTIASVDHVLELRPAAAIVDAAEHAPQGWTVAAALRDADRRVPVVVLVERDGLERYPWDEVADDVVYPGAPPAEIRVRLALLERRVGSGEGVVVRLGAVAIDTQAFRVTVAGRPVDVTFKEFELLRFLATKPGRVWTRPTLLREVWGYDFYGGTRTVDVHVRRLRAKLGPEHEHVIETVRGVGYRAAEPGRD